MQFQLASDIHIEKRYPKYCQIDEFINPVQDVENLILAGDIGSIYQYDQLKHFLLSCKTCFKNVVYVPGNNEYYSREGFDMKTKKELDQDLEALCKETSVILLNNSYVEVEEDLVIFGATWWSYIPDELTIRVEIEKGKRMTPDDFNYLHAHSRRCLNWLVDKCKASNQKILVITHFCPTRFGTMNGHHRKDDFFDLIPYYFSASEKFLKRDPINTWVFGHTHVFRDFFFNMRQTRLISNADPTKRFFHRNFVFEFPCELMIKDTNDANENSKAMADDVFI